MQSAMLPVLAATALCPRLVLNQTGSNLVTWILNSVQPGRTNSERGRSGWSLRNRNKRVVDV